MICTRKIDNYSFYLILFYLLFASNWENIFIFLVVWSLLSTIVDKKVNNINKDDIRWIIFLTWLILFFLLFYFSDAPTAENTLSIVNKTKSYIGTNRPLLTSLNLYIIFLCIIIKTFKKLISNEK